LDPFVSHVVWDPHAVRSLRRPLNFRDPVSVFPVHARQEHIALEQDLNKFSWESVILPFVEQVCVVVLYPLVCACVVFLFIPPWGGRAKTLLCHNSDN
jgi:hypothetical protein